MGFAYIVKVPPATVLLELLLCLEYIIWLFQVFIVDGCSVVNNCFIVFMKEGKLEFFYSTILSLISEIT